MSDSSGTRTANEVVANQIVVRFIANGLLPKRYEEQTRKQLADGKLKAEDWQLLAEKALEWEARESRHEQ